MSQPFPIPPEFASQPWRDVPDRALQPTRAVPTMLHRQEQRLYYWLTRQQIGGPGAVVDLGAFVGGSTARLAQGLADANSPARLHVYDRFTVDPVTKQKFLYDQGIAPFEGQDMLPLSRQLLAPWQDRITLHPGEIQQIGWDAANGPIAMLILDACKRTEWTDDMARMFYTDLIAGQSVINHQDFLQWNQPWLVPHMMMLTDFFQPLAYVPGTSLLFRCVRVPGPEDLATRQVAGLDDAALIRLIEQARTQFRGWGIGAALTRMIAGIRLNPGERRHWKMQPPPRAHHHT